MSSTSPMLTRPRCLPGRPMGESDSTELIGMPLRGCSLITYWSSRSDMQSICHSVAPRWNECSMNTLSQPCGLEKVFGPVITLNHSVRCSSLNRLRLLVLLWSDRQTDFTCKWLQQVTEEFAGVSVGVVGNRPHSSKSKVVVHSQRRFIYRHLFWVNICLGQISRLEVLKVTLSHSNSSNPSLYHFICPEIK